MNVRSSVQGSARCREQRETKVHVIRAADRPLGRWSLRSGRVHFVGVILKTWCELLLAVDGQELFDTTAHLFFEKVDSPYMFLQEETRVLDVMSLWNRAMVSDLLAYVHLLSRLPMKEPDRMKAVLEHLEGMLTMAKEMWKYYLAETNDDNEWIPNSRQTGVLRVPVSQEMIDTWLVTLEEVELLLRGERLLPFWRGNQADRGVNLRRVFTEPPSAIDLILWFQGTAATPYIEKGAITKLADPRLLQRINDTFGGLDFVGFAFWFN